MGGNNSQIITIIRRGDSSQLGILTVVFHPELCARGRSFLLSLSLNLSESRLFFPFTFKSHSICFHSSVNVFLPLSGGSIGVIWEGRDGTEQGKVRQGKERGKIKENKGIKKQSWRCEPSKLLALERTRNSSPG